MNYGRTSLRRRAKQLDARGTRIRHKIGVILGKLLLIGIIVGGCAAVSFGVGAFKGILASAPDISEVDVIPTGYSTKVLAADGSETAKLVAAGSNRQYVTIDQIPENLQHAVVAIEDERFYDHNGIDLKGIVRALVADVRTRDFSQGASTLTQQLIKNNVLSEQWANENDSNISKIEKMERQVQRKIQEQYLAIELEKKVNDKNWILENYLNSINLGSNTLGVQAAAQRYFGKDVSKLTLSECAVIAGITKNPAGYNPILHPKENAKRRKNVLDAMKKQGYISQKQYDKAMADDVYGRISEHNDVREETMNTYFVDAVIDDVFDDLAESQGDDGGGGRRFGQGRCEEGDAGYRQRVEGMAGEEIGGLGRREMAPRDLPEDECRKRHGEAQAPGRAHRGELDRHQRDRHADRHRGQPDHPAGQRGAR